MFELPKIIKRGPSQKDKLNAEKSNEATFDGGAWALKSSNNYAAYYPFIGDIYLDRTKVPVDYTGQVQKGKINSNEVITHLSAFDYMAAQAVTQTQGNLNFQFSHLGALVEVKFNVPVAGRTSFSSDHPLERCGKGWR